MIPEIGPKPAQYTAQPHLYGIHRRLYEMLGGRVANHLSLPALPEARQREVGDAFERAQEQQVDEPHPQRPDAVARLFTAVSNQLIRLGLLPPRPSDDVEQSMVGHSRDVAVAVNRFNLLSQRHWSTLNDKLQEINLVDGLSDRLEASADPDSVLSESNIDRPKAPEGLMLIGRLHLTDITLPERMSSISKIHLAAQVNGDNLILRDGFFPVDMEGTQLVGAAQWKPSRNGSAYADEVNRLIPIPSDRAIVLPNKPVKLKLGRYYFELDGGALRALEPSESEVLEVARANFAHVETNQRFKKALRGLEEGPTRSITLGREGDAGFVIDDEKVSRYHARITYVPAENAYYLHDLDSTNGTIVRRGGQDIPITGEPFKLKQRDNINLGRTTLVVNSEQINPE